MADVRIRPVTELDIEAICRIDERITGKYRPDAWEDRVIYYIRRDPDSSQVAEIGGRALFDLEPGFERQVNSFSNHRDGVGTDLARRFCRH